MNFEFWPNTKGKILNFDPVKITNFPPFHWVFFANVARLRSQYVPNLLGHPVYHDSRFNYYGKWYWVLFSSFDNYFILRRVTKSENEGEWLMRSSTQVASRVTDADDSSHIYIQVTHLQFSFLFFALLYFEGRKQGINWWCVYRNWADVPNFFQSVKSRHTPFTSFRTLW